MPKEKALSSTAVVVQKRAIMPPPQQRKHNKMQSYGQLPKIGGNGIATVGALSNSVSHSYLGNNVNKRDRSLKDNATEIMSNSELQKWFKTPSLQMNGKGLI